MGQKHVAKSGASAGQWVTCNAQQACRNGGRHLDSGTLKEISEKTYTPVKELTEDDVTTYLKQNPPAGIEKESLLHKLITLTPGEVKATHAPTPDVQPNDEYLGNDDSLSIEEKRAVLNKQLRQADAVLGQGNYSITRDPENQTLSCRFNSSSYVSKLTFTPDPQDSKKFTSNRVAIKYNNGAIVEYETALYNNEGQLHGNGQPALVKESDDVNEIHYYEDGEHHRDEDKPAIVTHLSTGNKIEDYYKDGKRHREGNKPAVIITNPRTGRTAHSYYIEGKLVKNTVVNNITGKTQDLGA